MTNPAPGFAQHPNYAVTISPVEGAVSVRVGDQIIATSQRAVAVHETKHRPVWYMPLEDVDATVIAATETQTYCPFKGHASYWRVRTPQGDIEDAIWAYMSPYDECATLKGYASFYTNKVDLYLNDELADSSGPGRT